MARTDPKPDAARSAAPSTPTTAAGLKLTVERDALLKALSHAAAIVERRNTIPILSNVLIEATDGKAVLLASDLDIQIQLEVPATVNAAGAVTVPAHMLHDIARELPAGAQVDLELAEAKLAVASGRSRYKLNTLPREDFPVVAGTSAEGIVRFAMPAAQLRHLLGKTAFAQCAEPTRFYLCGIRLQTLDGKLVAAATNGHCLAEAAIPIPEGAADAPGVILSTKFVGELRKLLDGCDGEVEVGLSPKRAEVSLGETVLGGKVIDGAFPDWRRVIPSQNDKKLLVGRESFTAAVKRASVVADEKTRAVRLDLTRDKLTASTSCPEYGSAVEEAPAVYEAADLTIGFNARYLLDTFAAIGSDELRVDLGDAAAPTLFTNPNDDSARWVVMPMRV